MYVYMVMLLTVIGGITLVESGCKCKPPMDEVPYQNVVCDAEFVIVFQRKGNFEVVDDGNFRKYKGKIIQSWKPRTPEIPKWVQEKLYSIKMNNAASIFTHGTCPVQLKKGKQYILTGSRRFGELFISRCQSLVLPYKDKYKDYEDNFKTNFQDNCDCQVRWEDANCSGNLTLDLADFLLNNAAGSDECIGTLEDRDCTNAIGYCSRDIPGGTCQWIQWLKKNDAGDENVIPGDVNGICHKEFCIKTSSGSTGGGFGCNNNLPPYWGC